MELSEVHSQGIHQFVAAVFNEMLVVGVVDYSRKVTFVVSELRFVCEFIVL